MAEPLRVGIISAAWGATAHLPAWRSLDGVEVVAICTSRPETASAAAERFQVKRAFHDFREMAADPDIDLIDCGTRPPLRFEMVMAALQAGKHVYNGIPFAKDLTDARLMRDARRKAGTVGAVDAFMQAVPALAAASAMIRGGDLGEMFGARVSFDAALFTAVSVNVPAYSWFADPANGASSTRNLGSHMLHLLVSIFGPVARVCADESLALREWPAEPEAIRPRVPDSVSMMLRFENGLPAQLSACWSMVGGPGFRFEAWGSKGRIVAEAPVFPMAHDTTLAVARSTALGNREQVPVAIPADLLTVRGSRARPDDPSTGLFAMARIFASVRDEITGRGQAAPNFEQAYHVQEVVEAAVRSSTERRWVDISAGDLRA